MPAFSSDNEFFFFLGFCSVVFRFVLLEKLKLADPIPNVNKCLQFYDFPLFTEIVMFTEFMTKPRNSTFWFGLKNDLPANLQ